MAFSTILSVVSVCLLLVCGGRLLYEQYYGKQNCEMTYMYLYPQYQVGGSTKTITNKYVGNMLFRGSI